MRLLMTMLLVLCALGAASLARGSASAALAPVVDLTPVPIWFSTQPGQHAGDEVFSPALQDALRANGKRPFSSVMALVATVEQTMLAKGKGRQSTHFTGAPDPSPLCPEEGPLRVHLLAQIEYRTVPNIPPIPGVTLDRERLPGAFRAACTDTVVTVHEDIGKAGWGGFLDAVEQAAQDQGGRTIVYVSAHGVQVGDDALVVAVDSEMKTADQALKESLQVAALHGRLQSACRNRCALWLDVSRGSVFGVGIGSRGR